MKVKIGKYEKHNSFYDFTEVLVERNIISEKTEEAIAEKFSPLFSIWNRRPWNKRKIKVRIDDYDVWNLHSTLAYIIVPLMEKFKECKQGAPYVDDNDVPDNLKTKAAKPLTQEELDSGHVDEFHFQRYEWIIDEIIWAFKEIRDNNPGENEFWKDFGEHSFEKLDNDTHELKWIREPVWDEEGLKKYHDRIQNGTRLFGTYFSTFWV